MNAEIEKAFKEAASATSKTATTWGVALFVLWISMFQVVDKQTANAVAAKEEWLALIPAEGEASLEQKKVLERQALRAAADKKSQDVSTIPLGWLPIIGGHLKEKNLDRVSLAWGTVCWSLILWGLLMAVLARRARLWNILGQAMVHGQMKVPVEPMIPEMVSKLPLWLLPLPGKDGQKIRASEIRECLLCRIPPRGSSVFAVLLLALLAASQIHVTILAIGAEGTPLNLGFWNSRVTREGVITIGLCITNLVLVGMWFIPRRVMDTTGQADSEAMISRRNALGLLFGACASLGVQSLSGVAALIPAPIVNLRKRWGNPNRKRRGLPSVAMPGVAPGFYSLQPANGTAEAGARILHYIDSVTMLRGFAQPPEQPLISVPVQQVIQSASGGGGTRLNQATLSHAFEDAAMSAIGARDFQLASALLTHGLRRDIAFRRASGTSPSLRLFDLMALMAYQNWDGADKLRTELHELTQETFKTLPQLSRAYQELDRRRTSWESPQGKWRRKLLGTKPLIWRIRLVGRGRRDEVREMNLRLAN